MIAAVRAGLANLADLIYPRLCAICQAPIEADSRVCPACMENLPVLGIGPVTEQIAFAQNLIGIWAVFAYSEAVQTLIHMMKYKGYQKLADELVDLAWSLPGTADLIERFDALVPVPLHRVRQRERGYNQSLLIAAAFSDRSGLPLLDGVLRRQKWTRSQTRLPLAERSTNVSAAFVATVTGDGRRILLIDDVVTTGSTLSASAEALRAAGWGDIGALTLAIPLIAQ